MNLPFIEFYFMVGIDILFFGALLLLMMPFGIWRQAAFAVMKRNFIGYFSNPTGYVFLCLFVLLTSFAAFWPHEFFTTNLANFEQLNRYLPYIMLVFIPAITMSIWSEERRQGTDELLLTLPAYDFDIVIGKYFAAVLVFTVSLLFSQLSNYAVLISMTGGDLDSGLLFSTYFGYWFVGIAMLSIGMVASFLTNNLTVGFIFGVVFNAPLAFFSNADVIISDNQMVNRLFEWSLLQRFDPFGRGLISLPSIFYFLGMTVVGIYLSLILIGRRHWQGGKHGTSRMGHFAFRTVCLIITVVGLVLVAQYSPANRLRFDVSRNQVSTLTENTRQILNELDQQSQGDPIIIDAYVGSSIPSDFVQTKYDLVNLLREFDVMGGNRVRVNLHTNVEPFSQEAILAEKRFGIRPVPYVSESRGAVRQEQVILGAAFTCGLDREVIEFFPYGSQVGYELVRSINTVAQDRRARIGIVETDVLAAGGLYQFNGRRFAVPALGIVDELKKQYDVERVTMSEPFEVFSEVEEDVSLEAVTSGEVLGKQFRYEVLLVIQPSKMSPVELENLIAAIRAGQPTIICEDPFPRQASIGAGQDQPARVGFTVQPRDANFPRGGSTETCKITDLWAALGISVAGMTNEGRFFPNLAWQKYNPYQRNASLDEPEILILDNQNPAAISQQINSNHPATAGIEELRFDNAGYFEIRPDAKNSGLFVMTLVVAQNAGKIPFMRYFSALKATSGNMQMLTQARGNEQPSDNFILAAWISSKEEPEQVVPGDINCYYVTDVDFLSDEMIRLKNSPRQGGVEYRFQNIPFVLNLVDSMTSQASYIPIRDRQQRYLTLRVVEDTIRDATDETDKELQEYEKVYSQRMSTERQASVDQVNDLKRDVSAMMQQKQEGVEVDEKALQAKQAYLQQVVEVENNRLVRLEQEMQNERNEIIRSKRLESELKIQEIQRKYKLAAVLIPPIPPLLLGLFVFTRRRLREREGISKARRLK
ncbi:MAG: Gldg family protein [Pirellulaceae bacterium]|nr:Gldg family protein [Pirellulaceae bacterium]